MRFKKFLKSTILMLIIILLCNSVYAGESGGRPSGGGSPPTSYTGGGGYSGEGIPPGLDVPGGGGDSSSGEPEFYSPPPITLEVKTEIAGKIFEDYKRLEKVEGDGSIDGTEQITNNYTLDDDEPGISGVRVENTITDENGNYSIKGAGWHNMTITYGNNVASSNDYLTNRDSLKYNGQDYAVVTDPNKTDKSYEREVKESKGSCTEVFMVIDFSSSMYESAGNDGSVTRIENVKKAAEMFVKELFSETDEGLRVGIVCFCNKPVILKMPTNRKEALITAINGFEIEDCVGKYNGKEFIMYNEELNDRCTNISSALQLANKSFISENSNHILILFSDGAPSSHEKLYEPLYNDDSVFVKERKLELIANYTRKDILEIIDDGAILINVLNQLYPKANVTDPEEDEYTYAQKTFYDANGNQIGNIINADYLSLDSVKDALLIHTKRIIDNTRKELMSVSSTGDDFNSADDYDRRRQVNLNYKEINFDRLKIFEVIDKLKGTIEDARIINEIKNMSYMEFIKSDEVKDFINSTYMFSKNDTYIEIEKYEDGPTHKVAGKEEFNLEPDGYWHSNSGGVYSDVTLIPITVEFNACLVKRDEFKLELSKKITATRLTLNDGTVLYNLVSDNANQTSELNNKAKEMHEKLIRGELINNDSLFALNINTASNFPDNSVQMLLDPDLAQGAQLDVEYTIEIKNSSGNGAMATSFEIVDFLNDDLVYRADSNLITENVKNLDYGWSYHDNIDYLVGSPRLVNSAVEKNYTGSYITLKYNTREENTEEEFQEIVNELHEEIVERILEPEETEEREDADWLKAKSEDGVEEIIDPNSLSWNGQNWKDTSNVDKNGNQYVVRQDGDNYKLVSIQDGTEIPLKQGENGELYYGEETISHGSVSIIQDKIVSVEPKIITRTRTRTTYHPNPPVDSLIGNNGVRYVKVVLSKVISAESIEHLSFSNQVEILQYNNTYCRRMNYIDSESGFGLGIGRVNYITPIPGNLIPTKDYNQDELGSIFTNSNEGDTSISGKIFIIPPFGKDKSKNNVIIAIVILTNMAAITYLLKRKKK